MADSLAFWTTKKIETVLHFNLWKLPKKKIPLITQKYSYFLDTGVKLTSTDEMEFSEDFELNIFLPFKLKEKNISDLSNILIQDQNLLDAIFNKPLSSSNIESEPFYKVCDGDNSIEFYILKLRDLYSIEEFEKGTHLKFKINKDFMNLNESLYIRYRIILNEEYNFSEYIDEADSLIKSGYKREELVEFRINEIRNLPLQLQEKLRAEKNEIMLKQIHYFLVRSNDANLELSHENYQRCRSVEDDIWSNYIGEKMDCDLKNTSRILSYHWSEKAKEDREIPHYGTFAKFSYTRNDTLFYFILIFFLVSFGIEFGSDYISSLWGKHNYIPLDIFVITCLSGISAIFVYLSFNILFKILKLIYVIIKSILSIFVKFICSFK